MRNSSGYSFTRFILLFLTFFIMINSCTTKNTRLKLAASFINGNPEESNYIKWVHQMDSTVEIIVLNQIPADQVEQALSSCDGLMLTGGDDIHPDRYGRPEDTVFCTMNPGRDTLEYMALKLAYDKKMPLLGICRGFQLLNVYFGGSLYADLPAQFGSLVQHRCEDPLSCEHLVSTGGENYLSQLTGKQAGRVTSNHHQGIRDLSSKLVSLACSGDNLTEAFTWADPESEPFMLAVQWHPERMDSLNTYSGELLREFLSKMKDFSQMTK